MKQKKKKLIIYAATFLIGMLITTSTNYLDITNEKMNIYSLFFQLIGASEDKIMDISKPISPLQGSPPSSTNCSGTSRSKRRTRHSTTPRQTSKNIVESSDEDNTEPIQPRKTPKKTPPKPRKTALPNKVTPNSVRYEFAH